VNGSIDLRATIGVPGRLVAAGRRVFWFAGRCHDHRQAERRSRRDLGEDTVLFLDMHGQPAALRDRCCHRAARLSVLEGAKEQHDRQEVEQQTLADLGRVVYGIDPVRLRYDRSGLACRCPAGSTSRWTNSAWA